jgi:signal transduction histidine kinase
LNRIWLSWLLFALCLIVLFAAMGWVSWTALEADRAEAVARRRAAAEENVRLALWRMDSLLAAHLARENIRPYFAYSPFYPAERAYTRMFSAIKPGEILIPSPLMRGTPPFVRLHFQFDPDGTLCSPQAPTGNMRDLAEMQFELRDDILEAEARLRRIAEITSRKALLAAVPVASPGRAQRPDAIGPSEDNVWQIERVQSKSQKLLNAAEWEARSRISKQALDNSPPAQQMEMLPPANDPGQQTPAGPQRQRNPEQQQSQPRPQPGPQNSQRRQVGQQQAAGPYTPVEEGPMHPVWAGGELLLVRRIRVGNGAYVQGCWLDWPLIRTSLLAEVHPLLPEADLRPAPDGADAMTERMLAALPVRLLPGAMPASGDGAGSAVRLSLMVAWACVLVAAAAVAVLLRGTMALSERRGAFVSAVTHEMRTPLTTFRMYTEMLASGMVGDEVRRREYLDTLYTEANRLSHLVANVLAYARLERGRAKSRAETLPLRGLLDRMTDRLAARAGQAGMSLNVDAADHVLETAVHTDPAAVEQILFNLVDNACKYAAADRALHVSASREDGRVALRVRDHGPGISRKDARRLFQPFTKSERDATNGAPGVGLGLALSRRLARSLGGDLRLDGAVDDGACFVLTVPTAATGAS